jgi:cardiolipin synthase
MNWKDEKLYFDEESYFSNLIANLDTAQTSVELETYIFVPDDKIGQAVSSKLKEISKRGVAVRVLVDAIGSFFWAQGISETFSDSKVELKFFRSFWWQWWRVDLLFRKFSFLNQRLHRKTCLIDGKTLFIGSFNINHKESRETGASLEAENLTELKESFNKLWKRRWYFVRHHFSQVSTVLRFNESRRVRRFFNRDLAQRISQAETRVWITNAYFVPPLFILRALLKATDKGIDVRILVSERSDLPLFKNLTSSFYRTLLSGNVQIFEYQSRFLHAKSMLIDDWALVGSSNLNYRSLLHDLEIDVVLQSTSSIELLEQQYVLDQKHSTQITLEHLSHFSVLDRMIGWLLLRFKNWL